MSVQGSSRQCNAEIQADKNRLSQICLSILEIFWYLWYPGDPPRDAKSLGQSLCLWEAVYGTSCFLIILQLRTARLGANFHLSSLPCKITTMAAPPPSPVPDNNAIAALHTATDNSPIPYYRPSTGSVVAALLFSASTKHQPSPQQPLIGHFSTLQTMHPTGIPNYSSVEPAYWM
jgi:hypothetical protein